MGLCPAAFVYACLSDLIASWKSPWGPLVREQCHLHKALFSYSLLIFLCILFLFLVLLLLLKLQTSYPIGEEMVDKLIILLILLEMILVFLHLI